MCHCASFTKSPTVLPDCAKYDTDVEMLTEEMEMRGRERETGGRMGNLRGVQG